MPIYEYQCGKCGEQHEIIQKFSDAPKRKCPSCGALRLKKLISAPAFHLKGDGWYVTDFRDKGKKKKDKDKAGGESATDAKDKTDKSEKKESSSKSESKSKDKPASGDTKSQAA